MIRDERVEFLTYKGKRILLIDFSKLKAGQVLLVMHEAKVVISRQPEQSVLTLTNITEMHFDEKIMAALKKYVTHNKPYVKAGAVVGAKGLQAVVKMGVERASLRKLTDFDNRGAAQEWLIQQ